MKINTKYGQMCLICKNLRIYKLNLKKKNVSERHEFYLNISFNTFSKKKK